MKTAGIPLLAFALAGSLPAAEDAATPRSVKTSARLKQEIQATLPKYAPPPKVLDQPKEVPNDPDVLALPKITVKEYRPRDHDPDVWLTDKGVQQKALAAYKQSMSEFEWALNSWFIPLFSAPPSARARSAYEMNKSMEELRRVHRLFNIISATDAKAAGELEAERVKMEQTEYWQSRPAGHGRSK